MKKVSIIVPIYNVEKYLDDCIKSIINQTYNNIEIILIDDGSTDKSKDMCDIWKLNDNRIIVVHKENGGLSSARNAGIKIATGDYLAFVDSDDIIDEKMIENLVDLLKEEKADISVCKFKKYLEKDNPKFSYLDEKIIYDKNNALKELLFDRLTSHVCNKLFKKELFGNIEFPEGKNYEDLRTTYKIIEKCNKIVETKSELYGYMIRDDSITQKFGEKNLENYIEAVNERYLHYKKKYQNLNTENIQGKINYIYTYYFKIAYSNSKSLLKNIKLKEEYKFLKENLKGNIKLNYYKLLNRKQRLLLNILMFSPTIYFYTIQAKIKLKKEAI